MKTLTRHSQSILSAIAIISFADNAVACKFRPDERPYAERIKEVQEAFVGVIEDNNGKYATLRIEHSVVGAHAKGDRVAVGGGQETSCHIRFEPGTRWFYAGDTAGSLSRFLGRAEDASGTHLGILKRNDDSKIKLSSQWQICDADEQCQPINYGCTMTSANRKFHDEAQKHAWAKGGDPRAISCAQAKAAYFYRSLCVQNRCGYWVMD